MALDVTGIGTAVSGIKDILKMFFPDKTEEDLAKMQQAFQLVQMQATNDNAQIAVNQASSAAGGLTFRDGAGWVCVFGLAISSLKPVIEWSAHLAGHPIILPPIDTNMTYSMLTALLGLGAYHMNEQIKSNK